jgi:acyl-CoA synthetase (AMP-forming)/AMP-acid ligase II
MSAEHRSEAAVGWTWFAGIMMLLLGLFWNYIFKLDVSTWGWVHLILGIVVFLASLALFQGAVWARTVGVILAGLSALVGFVWLPWYPIWGIIFIVTAVFVIWALTVHGRDVTKYN